MRFPRSLRQRVGSRPINDGRRPRPSYYVQQPTCQIAGLAQLYTQFLGVKTDGTFVEIGANDGVFVSNTWGLAERGWRGIMVEPMPDAAAKCRVNHRSHPNVQVVEVAIGSRDDEFINLHSAGPLTTGNPDLHAEYGEIDWARAELTDREVRVLSRSLNTLLREHQVPEGFEVLSVDVEGLEKEVFEGFDLHTWRPQFIIVELADTHPDLRATRRADAQLGLEIAANGYAIVYKDWINTVFVSDQVYVLGTT